jgi:hypothetical protein
MRGFPESDWKILRRLKPIALDRFCERVLTKIGETAVGSGSAHERYLAIFSLIMDRDKELANCFNGMSRSNAMFLLIAMRSHDLITDEEMTEFSEDTQAVIRELNRR